MSVQSGGTQLVAAVSWPTAGAVPAAMQLAARVSGGSGGAVWPCRHWRRSPDHPGRRYRENYPIWLACNDVSDGIR